MFFDEVDAIALRRGRSEDSHVTERVISQMLTEMDGLEDLKGVVVIGATNRPDIIDEALLRPGRFDRILEVPLPDKDARRQILNIHLRKKPLKPSVNLEELVELTDKCTGADIAAAINAAALAAIKEHLSTAKDGKQSSENNNNKQKSNIDGKLSISMENLKAGLQKVLRKAKTIQNSDIV